jgi:hypothetical protein
MMKINRFDPLRNKNISNFHIALAFLPPQRCNLSIFTCRHEPDGKFMQILAVDEESVDSFSGENVWKARRIREILWVISDFSGGIMRGIEEN